MHRDDAQMRCMLWYYDLLRCISISFRIPTLGMELGLYLVRFPVGAEYGYGVLYK
jgi:hypothetical protein